MPIDKIEVAGYGLLVIDQKLLCVSNDGEFWYFPGGRQKPGENLKSCVIRELREETGLEVACGDLAAMMEVIDPDYGKHKVTPFFHVYLVSGELKEDWQDLGQVRHRRFFSYDEIMQNDKIIPRRIVANPFWLDLSAGANRPLYFGYEPFTIKDES